MRRDAHADGSTHDARRSLDDKEQDDPAVVGVAEGATEDRLEAVDDVLHPPGGDVTDVDRRTAELEGDRERSRWHGRPLVSDPSSEALVPRASGQGSRPPREESGIKCWGYTAYGQLGDGSATDSPTPVDVLGLDSRAESVAVGYYHSCALMSTGAVKCWGKDYGGALGDGTSIDRPMPVDVVVAR